jgi:amino-acid N-acetyltransferase
MSNGGSGSFDQFSSTNGSGAPPPEVMISDNLGIDPRTIEITRHGTPGADSDDGLTAAAKLPPSFVPMFRGSANYIANHRATLAVYHIPGKLLEDPDNFRDLMNDVALTWLLGMKIVLVAGCRHQIDKRLGGEKRQLVNGMLVTDHDTLRVIKEEAGYVRFEVERQLARSLRMHGDSSNSLDGNVVSGNFYSAQPFGILDGVDYQFSGFVRRVEADKIKQLHANRDVCLLSTLGVSPSGEVFNVNSEALAATVAGSLGASKIIFFTNDEVILKSTEFGNQIQSLRLSDATNFLKHRGIEMDRRGRVQGMDDVDEGDRDMLLKIGWAKAALEQNVKRAHILAPSQGALLQELYTRDGSGTLVSRDIYEGIRRANVNDVVGIYELISPLIQMGTLVDRPKATLERSIGQYYVYTRDNLVVACGQLKTFEDGFAEIGCLVVKKEYRSGGKGDSMLGYLERLCLRLGATKVFVLSTQTMEWFIEREFEEVYVEKLPSSRQATYNHARASKIYMKLIDSDRELDASELWWNR